MPEPLLNRASRCIALARRIALEMIEAVKRSGEKEQLTREAPFLSALAYSMSHIGVPLHSVLLELRDSRILRATSKMGRRLGQLLRIIQDPVDALYQLASETPSDEVRQFLRGYASTLRSGGSPEAYLKAMFEHYATTLEDKWRRYTSMLTDAEELFSMTFMLGSFILAIYAFFSRQTLPVVLFSALVMPLLGLLLLLAVSSSFPGLRTTQVSLTEVLPYPLTLLAFIILYIVGGMDLGEALAASSIPLLAIGLYRWYGFYSRRRTVSRQISEVITRVIDYVRLGFPLDLAFERVLEDEEYDPKVYGIVGGVLKGGLDKDLLGLVEEEQIYMLYSCSKLSGNIVPPLVLERLEEFTRSASYRKREAYTRARVYWAASIAYIPVLYYSLNRIAEALESLGGHLEALSLPGVAAPGGIGGWILLVLTLIPLLVNTFMLDYIENKPLSPLRKGVVLLATSLSYILLL